MKVTLRRSKKPRRYRLSPYRERPEGRVRAVVHGDLGDPEVAIRGEDGMKAELAVDPHAAQDLGLVRLQAAVHVMEADPGDDRGRPVEHAREQSPRPRIVPPRLPARDEIEALVELGEELRDFGRVVLEVGVHGDDDVATSLEEPGP